MKVKELKEQIQKAGTVITNNMVVPILEYVLVDENRFISTDLSTWIISKTSEYLSGTPFLLPARITLKLLQSMNPENKIKITLDKEKVIIESQEVSFSMIIEQEVDDFPNFPKEHPLLFTGGFESMKDIMLATKFTDEDELRPAMNGIHISKSEVVSTNGHLLFHTKHNSKIKEPFTMNCDPKAFSLLKGLIQFKVNAYNVILNDTKTTVIVKTVDEKFPEYLNIIPGDPEYYLEVSREDLINAVKVASTVNYNRIYIEVGKTISVWSDNLDFGTKSGTNIEFLDTNIEHLTFAVNPKYLIKILSVLEMDSVVIKFITQGEGYNRGIVIDDEFLLMPIMI